MKKLFDTSLFGLLAENSKKVSTQEIKNAYEDFIAHIDTVSQADNDLTSIIRKLNITRAELVFLETVLRYEQGKKCPQISLSSKSPLLS
jgi:hypothetical protein